MCCWVTGSALAPTSNSSTGPCTSKRSRRSLPDHVIELFERYGTTDFEQVLRQLDEGQWLARHYRLAETDIERDMATDYELLKSALVDAIANTHPAIPNEIDETSLASAADFLTSFDNVFTTNYDLLLYWHPCSGIPFRSMTDSGARKIRLMTT